MRAPYTEAEAAAPAFSTVSSLPASARPTVAMVDLNALAHNYQEAVRYADGRKIIAVVKAGAYGHGAVAISRCLLKLGTDMLGVALLEEGQELRQAGIKVPILVMGALFPAQAEAIVESGLTPVIFDKALAHTLSQAAEKRGVTIPVHVKIDTGMNRIGLSPEEAPAFIRELQKSGCLSVQGLMTHFADVDLRDKAFAAKQMDCFEALVKALEVEGIIIPHRHAANSAALLDYDRALFTMVRPGLMLYGYNPLEEDKSGTKLRPALSLTTRIACIKNVSAGASISYGRTFVTKRESVIATLPIGYADGYSRGLSNKGEALVRGIRVPVVGRVCMDMCMLDVTEVPDVQAGDEVVLIGKQGQITITADDLAAKTGTIAYEVLCGITSRIPRIYV